MSDQDQGAGPTQEAVKTEVDNQTMNIKVSFVVW
jgi:hypothetical protein